VQPLARFVDSQRFETHQLSKVLASTSMFWCDGTASGFLVFSLIHRSESGRERLSRRIRAKRRIRGRRTEDMGAVIIVAAEYWGAPGWGARGFYGYGRAFMGYP
jgi:hypothetical protein